MTPNATTSQSHSTLSETVNLMINIKVIDNEKGGHDDIIFSIGGFINELTLDSYWLIVGSNCQTFHDVKTQSLTY